MSLACVLHIFYEPADIFAISTSVPGKVKVWV